MDAIPTNRLRDFDDILGRNEKDVKGYLRDFLKSPEISDYTDYETITPIRNGVEIRKNSCNLSLESV